jgi:hypothetical protein
MPLKKIAQILSFPEKRAVNRRFGTRVLSTVFSYNEIFEDSIKA